MNRRKLILGLGTATAGAVTTLGTGAYTAAQATRDAEISIVDDSHGLIGLIANPDVSGVHDDSGELAIDLSGDSGINQSSIYQFGYFVDDSDAETIDALSNSGFPFRQDMPSGGTNPDNFGSAFLIANQTDNEQTLEINYEVDPGNDIETEFWFEAHNEGEQKGLIDEAVDTSKQITLAPGQACGVSFLIYAPPSKDTLGDEIEGSLSVTAGEAVDDNSSGGDEDTQAPT